MNEIIYEKLIFEALFYSTQHQVVVITPDITVVDRNGLSNKVLYIKPSDLCDDKNTWNIYRCGSFDDIIIQEDLQSLKEAVRVLNKLIK